MGARHGRVAVPQLAAMTTTRGTKTTDLHLLLVQRDLLDNLQTRGLVGLGVGAVRGLKDLLVVGAVG